MGPSPPLTNQIHDKGGAESICDMVGTVCRSIGAVDKDGGKFMRVKVNLDIYLPLRQG